MKKEKKSVLLQLNHQPFPLLDGQGYGYKIIKTGVRDSDRANT